MNRMKFILLTAIITLSSTSFSLKATEPDVDYDRGIQLLDAGQYKDALKAFGRSAKKGNLDAEYQIGIMFLEGQGINPNPEDAAYWFRKAAQNGHAASQFEIGYCFLNGTGVQKDERMAGEWFWRAAEQGDPDAALLVARMYRNGTGMKQDTEMARKYFRIAADAGIEEAKSELDRLPAPIKKPAKQTYNKRKRK